MVFGMAFSMLADICDLDEIETNKRREGSYCAVYQWITKMAFHWHLWQEVWFWRRVVLMRKLKAQTVSTINQLPFSGGSHSNSKRSVGFSADDQISIDRRQGLSDKG